MADWGAPVGGKKKKKKKGKRKQQGSSKTAIRADFLLAPATSYTPEFHARRWIMKTGCYPDWKIRKSSDCIGC